MNTLYSGNVNVILGELNQDDLPPEYKALNGERPSLVNGDDPVRMGYRQFTRKCRLWLMVEGVTEALKAGGHAVRITYSNYGSPFLEDVFINFGVAGLFFTYLSTSDKYVIKARPLNASGNGESYPTLWEEAKKTFEVVPKTSTTVMASRTLASIAKGLPGLVDGVHAISAKVKELSSKKAADRKALEDAAESFMSLVEGTRISRGYSDEHQVGLDVPCGLRDVVLHVHDGRQTVSFQTSYNLDMDLVIEFILKLRARESQKRLLNAAQKVATV